MPENFENFTDWMQQTLPQVLMGIGILVVGWLAALILSSVVRALFNKTSIDEKLGSLLAGEGKAAYPIDRWLAMLVKGLVLLYTLVVFVDYLGLEQATAPLDALLSKIMEFLPNLAGAGILLFVGWLVALALRALVEKSVDKLGIDKRVNEATGDEAPDVSIGKSIGTAVYWIVLFVFLLLILDSLEFQEALEPLSAMTTKVFEFLPNLLSAAFILLIGWFAANIIRRIVTSVTAALGIDRLADRTGISKAGTGTLSGLLGTIAFLLVLLPVLAMSLDALKLSAVSDPIKGMLTTLADAIPMLLFAAVILGVAVVVGRLISGLVADFLARIGFDNILGVLGLSTAKGATDENPRRPSAIAGQIVFIAILLFASMEALDKLELTSVSELVGEFIELAGGWLFGLLIFGLGLWLANFVAGVIRERDTRSSALLARAAWIGIATLAGIEALTRMGVADDVVKDVVRIVLAASGLALALAFGLGCKEQASDQLRQWRGGCESDDDEACGDDEAAAE